MYLLRTFVDSFGGGVIVDKKLEVYPEDQGMKGERRAGMEICIAGVQDNDFMGSGVRGTGEQEGKCITQSAFKEHSFIC